MIYRKGDAGLSTLGKSSSIDQFVSQAASDLIQAVGLLIEAGLAIANAAFDGLLHAIDSVIALVFDPSTGIVNQTIDIPVLSWLYQELTGENLTVVNAITLVAAIPITVIWRVFEGEWPSQSLAGEVHDTLLRDAQLGVSQVVVTIMTVLGGVFDLFGGAFSAAVDAVSDLEPDTPGAPTGVDEILPNCALGCALFGAIIAFPTAQSTDAPTDLAWANWGATLGVACFGIFSTVGGDRISEGGPLSAVLKYLNPWVMALLNIFVLSCGVFTWIDAHSSDPINNLGLAIAVATVAPGLLNPIKLFGETGAAFVVLLDLLMGCTTAILSFVVAGMSQAAAS
ncbi:MAG: hypothetical protein JO057_03620, partial [Chloroflexi bacterium]|nr:hypothetical protein [Chloroflexota bacterium]